MPYSYISCTIIIFVFISYSCIKRNGASLKWTESTTPIPEISACFAMAVGVYNNSVWLLGGYGAPSARVIEINLITETAENHAPSIRGSHDSPTYCQRNSVLFVASMEPDLSFINYEVFDLHLQMKTDTIPKYNVTNARYLCIAANDKYLFRTGGQDASNNRYDVFYIYNFNTSKWFEGVSMPQELASHSCNVLDSSLYVIGGRTPAAATDSVISMDVSDPYSNVSWSWFPDTLKVARMLHRSAVYGTFIYVSGGKLVSTILATVEIIDTVNGNIFLDSSMKHAKRSHSLVVANAIFYSFGGYKSTNPDNTYYQYAVLPKRRVSPLTWHESIFEIPMISDKHKTAVSAYNNSVWIFGGDSGGGSTELIEINLSTQTTTTHAHTNTMPFISSGQMYCQRGSVLFLSYSLSPNITGFDLSLQFTKTHDFPKYDTINDEGVCIAANDAYLFATGGTPIGTVNVFHIYNFSAEQWSEGAPLPDARYGHSCNIAHGSLYIIAGFVTSTDQTDSVIFIDIHDPHKDPSWSVFPDSLYVARSRFRSVVYKDYMIYVAGM